ncbi:MAG: hypothetical protein K6V97_13400 [Actinomycetia bacterium]|nr:hypothetical protein [Actinomycetes bacterium]
MSVPGVAKVQNAPPLRLPLTFFLTGLAGLVGALLDLVSHPVDLLAFRVAGPALLSTTHFLTLGFVSMVMMGAMYQLVPVVLDSRLASVRLGFWHYGIYVSGVGLLIAGMARWEPVLMVMGGSFVVVGVSLFLVNMAKTLRGARLWSLSGYFLVASLACLAAVVGFGWLLAFNFVHPWFSPVTALGVHMALGLGGWFTLTLVGVSYKLLPMFTLAHAEPKAGWWAFGGFSGAVPAAAVGLWWTPAATIPAAGLAALGTVAYLVDVAGFLATRRRRHVEPAILLALTGPTALLTLWIAAAGATLRPHLWPVVFMLFFFGWMGASIVGYLQKIIPFLVWLHAFSGNMGRGKVPLMKDLFPESWGWQVLGPYVAGLGMGVAGLTGGSTALTVAGLGLLGLAVLRLALAVGVILARRRRTPDSASGLTRVLADGTVVPPTPGSVEPRGRRP